MNTVPNAKEKELIIQNYIAGYNSFDIDKMARDLDPSIKFENISGGQSNMILTGLADFRRHAEQAKNLFSRRTQSILSFNHKDNCTEVEIDYNAVLAADFPNGLKGGDEINLKGKSIFKFKENRVIELTGIS
jgi:hypothetical protein